MKARVFVFGVIAAGLSSEGANLLDGHAGLGHVGECLHAGAVRSVLPSPSNAKALLNVTTRHREWVNVSPGASPMLAFVVYPERSDKAPVVLVTARDQSSTPVIRAVADQLAAEGFVSIVPDERSRHEDARKYAHTLPAANNRTAWIDLDVANARADVVSTSRSGVDARFVLTDARWPELVTYLSRVTGNNPPRIEGRTRSIDEHATHMGHALAMAAQQSGSSAASRMIPGLGDKAPNLPASYYTATQTLAQSKLKKEWVDIPVGDVKLHTWVEYPAGNNKTGVVIVMQHGVGLDDWMRSVADQIRRNRPLSPKQQAVVVRIRPRGSVT